MLFLKKKSFLIACILLLIVAALSLYVTIQLPQSEISKAERYSPDKLNIENSEALMNGVKAVYYYDGYLFCAKDNSIIKTKDFGKTYEHVADIDYSHLPWNIRVFKYFDISRRMARLDVFRLRISPNGNIVFTSKGGVFLIPMGEKRAVLVSPTPESRPISLTLDKEGNFYYGEYINNHEKREIHIYKSSLDAKSWNVVYTIPQKMIRHVHAVEYDSFENCFWIATGDDDNETYLMRASADFKNVKTVLHGGQKNRFFEIKIRKDTLFLTPDAPSDDNYVTIYEKKHRKSHKGSKG